VWQEEGVGILDGIVFMSCERDARYRDKFFSPFFTECEMVTNNTKGLRE